MDKLNKKQIEELLPHREPMLLIDELYDIKKLMSFAAWVVKSDDDIPKISSAVVPV